MFDAGAIVGRMVLDTKQFNDAVDTVRLKGMYLADNMRNLAQKTTEFGKSIYYASRNVRQVATGLMFLGAGVITPLIATFKSAEKYSNNVRQEMERLNNVTIQLRMSVAEALVPVMHRLTNVIADLKERWMSLSPQVQQTILQTVFVAGMFLLLGGSIMNLVAQMGMLVGAILRLAGGFATLVLSNLPLAAIIIIVGAIVVAMLKWKSVMVVVISTAQGMASVLNTVFSGVLAIVEALVGSIAKVFAFLLGILEKAGRLVNSELTEKFKGWREELDKFASNTFSKSVANMDATVVAFNDTVDIAQGKNTEWADSVEGMREKFGNLKEMFSTLFEGLGTKEFDIPDNIYEASKTFAEGWIDSLKDVLNKLRDFGAMAQSIVDKLVTNLQTLFSDFFYNVLTGQVRDMKQLFVDFGNFVLRILSEVLAQLVVTKIVAGITGAFSGGGSYANVAGMGKVNVAPANYFMGAQEGLSPVPYTGVYRLHEGEEVTPKYGAGRKESLPITIYNMITPEAIAMAMSGREGEGVIVNVINLNSLRNGVIRREAVRR